MVKRSHGLTSCVLMAPFDSEKIGDDLDADLGKGTWQLDLRRILGEFGIVVRMLATVGSLTPFSTFLCAVRTGKFRAGDDERGEKPADEVHDSLASWVEGFLTTELNDGQ